MKTSTQALPPLRTIKILDQLRERIRYLHNSLWTVEAYVYRVRRYIRFHRIRHRAEMGAPEVEAYLSWLVNDRKVAASTHKQALAALLFQYSKILCMDMSWLKAIGSPRIYKKLPVVLSQTEVGQIFLLMIGEHQLFAQLFYGTGLRITEGLRLRVNDIDFERRAIIVREGKGGGYVARSIGPSIERPVGTLTHIMGCRSKVWSIWCRNGLCLGSQLPASMVILDLVLGFSSSDSFYRSSLWCSAPSSSV